VEEKHEEAVAGSGQAIASAAKPASVDEDSKEDEATAAIDEQVTDAVGAVTGDKGDVPVVGNGVEDTDPSTAATSLQEERASSKGDDEELWTVEPSMDSVQMMGDAFVRSIQPSLDASIQRIEELRSNQKVRRIIQMVCLTGGAVSVWSFLTLQHCIWWLMNASSASCSCWWSRTRR
jgi:hypothetical protein